MRLKFPFLDSKPDDAVSTYNRLKFLNLALESLYIISTLVCCFVEAVALSESLIISLHRPPLARRTNTLLTLGSTSVCFVYPNLD